MQPAFDAPLIDISPPVRESSAIFPGDRPYRRDVSLCIAAGDNIDLSSIRTTVHIGAHADAPSHYVAGGQDIASRALTYYFGPAEVVAVAVENRRIGLTDLPAMPRSPRVLFQTGSFPDPDAWQDSFASLEPGLVDALAAGGTRLIGIDTPSIDPAKDAELRAHQRVAAHDMAILEGLVLGHVSPGPYVLVALPLRLVGADAAPVRAALLPYCA